MGINPDLDIDPECIGFQQEDVKNTDTSCFLFSTLLFMQVQYETPIPHITFMVCPKKN
jgi:hypothetical protein